MCLGNDFNKLKDQKSLIQECFISMKELNEPKYWTHLFCI